MIQKYYYVPQLSWTARTVQFFPILFTYCTIGQTCLPSTRLKWLFGKANDPLLHKKDTIGRKKIQWGQNLLQYGAQTFFFFFFYNLLTKPKHTSQGIHKEGFKY